MAAVISAAAATPISSAAQNSDDALGSRATR